MTKRLWVLAILVAVALPLAADAGSPNVKRKRKAKRVSAKQFARIELGRRLFFDPQVSRSEARSCASCHAPDHGWSDPDAASADDVGDTRRHSQTIIDAAFNPSAHWDGEFATVESLVIARVGTPTNGSGSSYGGGPRSPTDPTPRRPGVTPNKPGKLRGPVTGRPTRPRPHGGFALPGQHGTPADDPLVPTRRPLLADVHVPQHMAETVAERLALLGRYDEGFKAAFGSRKPTLARIAKAVAAFVHSIESTTSPFDRHRTGDEHALTAQAKRGLALFEGRAGCNACHISSGEHTLLTDFDFHNTGVAWDVDLTSFTKGSVNSLRAKVLRGRMPRSEDFRTALTPLMDNGRGQFTQAKRDRRAFKTPTLRDVALRGPFMHDGRFATLHEVVRYYAEGCGSDKTKDERLKPFDITPSETDDLVAFLTSLTGETRPGLATKRWSKRARRTRLKFVDPTGKPLGKLPVMLVPVGDGVPETRTDDARLELLTDATGAVHFKPGARTHTRVVLPDELPLVGGELVPDTCRTAEIVVPVRGRVTFLIAFPAKAEPPARLVGDHPNIAVPQGHALKRTRFVRGPVLELAGKKFARYEGWLRSDVSNVVRLRLPGVSVRKHRGNPHTYNVSPGAEIRVDLTDM